MNKKPYLAKLVLLTLAVLSLVFQPRLTIPHLDKKADHYFSKSMTEAGLAYGVCRVINGSVSVIKESQIQVEPAGIGVTLAAGQVLDPLDDMTERASDILVTAIVALGIQKIAYELSVALTPLLFSSIAILFVVTSLIPKTSSRRISALMLNGLIFIAIARLCLPVSALVSDSLNTHYFHPQITQAQEDLALSAPNIDAFNNVSMPEVDGVMGTVKNGFSFVADKSAAMKLELDKMVSNLSSMTSNLVKISYLYATLFIIQVILLPLGSFWIFTTIARTLFAPKQPPVSQSETA